MVFQKGREIIHGHPVDAGRTLVAPDLRQRLPQIVALDNPLHRRPLNRWAFNVGARRDGFGPSGSGGPAFTP